MYIFIEGESSIIDNYRFGREFQDLKEIGSGQGGTVFKTIHLPKGKLYAKKVINIRLDSHRQLKSITAELSALQNISEKEKGGLFLIKVYGIMYRELKLSIIMEWMDVGSLSHVIKSYGPLPEHLTSHVCRCMIKALLTLMSIGIVHRDIKPGNMLVNKKGEIKLCDFGECSFPDVIGHRRLISQVGTVAYMAPERILGKVYDERSEAWSLGISALEIFIGQHPLNNHNSKKDLIITGNGNSNCSLPTPPLSATLKNPIVSLVDDISSIAAIELAEIITRDDIIEEYKLLLSPCFYSFIKVCLQKDYQNRPKVEDLLIHPFIIKYLNVTKEDVKGWLFPN